MKAPPYGPVWNSSEGLQGTGGKLPRLGLLSDVNVHIITCIWIFLQHSVYAIIKLQNPQEVQDGW